MLKLIRKNDFVYKSWFNQILVALTLFILTLYCSYEIFYSELASSVIFDSLYWYPASFVRSRYAKWIPISWFLLTSLSIYRAKKGTRFLLLSTHFLFYVILGLSTSLLRSKG